MLICDLNCDVGEGIGNEEALMPFISSANIACGYHAGDRDTIRRTVDLCLQYQVNIGAHPSYADKENFGRVDLVGKSISAADVQNLVREQLFIIQQIIHAQGGKLHHIKPHGALYNRAARDEAVGNYICLAVKQTDPAMVVYGLSGSRFKKVVIEQGLAFADEVFADRSYQDDGSLTPRTKLNALIGSEEAAVKQVREMVFQKTVTTVTGKQIAIEADTVCLHGDGPDALAFAKKIAFLLRQKA